MLKKIGYIIVASLLTLSTMGFVISRHYCNSMLVSVTLDAAVDHCCDGKMDGNCCHSDNEYIVLKADYALPLIQQIDIAETDVFNLWTNTLAETEPAQVTQAGNLYVFCPGAEKYRSISFIQSFCCSALMLRGLNAYIPRGTTALINGQVLVCPAFKRTL